LVIERREGRENMSFPASGRREWHPRPPLYVLVGHPQPGLSVESVASLPLLAIASRHREVPLFVGGYLQHVFEVTEVLESFFLLFHTHLTTRAVLLQRRDEKSKGRGET
jgi:hypothetical protein